MKPTFLERLRHFFLGGSTTSTTYTYPNYLGVSGSTSTILTDSTRLEAVETLIAIISGAVKQLPLSVVRGKQKTPFRHPLDPVLNLPSPELPRERWIEKIVRDLIIDGNSLFLISRKSGQVVTIAPPLDSQAISYSVCEYKSGSISVPALVYTSGKDELDPADVLHFRLRSKNGYTGCGINELMHHKLTLLAKLQHQINEQTDLQPAGIISVPKSGG